MMSNGIAIHVQDQCKPVGYNDLSFQQMKHALDVRLAKIEANGKIVGNAIRPLPKLGSDIR
jgi:hypothetical protein